MRCVAGRALQRTNATPTHDNIVPSGILLVGVICNGVLADVGPVCCVVHCLGYTGRDGGLLSTEALDPFPPWQSVGEPRTKALSKARIGLAKRSSPNCKSVGFIDPAIKFARKPFGD
jgi:hypothetical protein